MLEPHWDPFTRSISGINARNNRHVIIANMGLIIAIDIGGTQLRVAVYTRDSTEPIRVERTATRGMENGVFERLTGLIDSIWPNEGVDAISVAAPGPSDPFTGMIVTTPNISAWKNYPLVEKLEKIYKVPTFLGNDANMAVLAEWKYGAGQGHHDVVYLTISTGIGGGVISGDQLIEGAHGIATELGHTTVVSDGPLCSCGCRGHLEAVAAGPAIAGYVREQIAKGRKSILQKSAPFGAQEVAEAARKGDSLAIESYNRAGGFLGQAIADFLHIFNPSIVILGGGVSQSGNLIIDPIKESMKKHIMSQSYLDGLEIATVKLGDSAGLLGSLVQAQIRLSKSVAKKGEIYGTA